MSPVAGTSSFLLGYNTSGFSRCRDLDSVIGWTAEAGFSAIEISFDPGHVMPGSPHLDRHARHCRKAGLAVACGAGARHALGPAPHLPSWVSPDPAEREAREAFLRDSVRAAARLGSRVLVLHSGPLVPGTSTHEAWARLEAGLARLLPLAAREGIVLAFEFHPSMLIADRKGAERLLDAVPGLRLTLDIGHVQCTEGPPLAPAIRTALPRTAHVHLEDIKGRVHEHLPIGDGEIPFDEVFRVLAGEGYDGIVAAEFHSRSIELEERELARRTFSRLAPFL